MGKLKHLRSTLRVWNFLIFGDVNRQIKTVLVSWSLSNYRWRTLVFFKALHLQELEAYRDLDIVLTHQESMLREKSRVKWFLGGDRNSFFYHLVI